MAALEDEEFKEKTLKNNEEGKTYLYNEFEKMKLSYATSQTNFVFVDLKTDSNEFFQALLKQGIIIRPGHLWNCPTFVRITIGTMDQNRKFINALKEYSS